MPPNSTVQNRLSPQIFQNCTLIVSWGSLGQDWLIKVIFKVFEKQKMLKKD